MDNGVKNAPTSHDPGMSFEDLPRDWASKPLWDNNLADVVDLLFSLDDRLNNGLLFLTSHSDGIPIRAPFMGEDMNWRNHDFVDRLDVMADEISNHASHILVAFGHSEPGVTSNDLAWRKRLEALFGRHGLTAIGFFAADPHGVHPVPNAPALVE